MTLTLFTVNDGQEKENDRFTPLRKYFISLSCAVVQFLVQLVCRQDEAHTCLTRNNKGVND